MALFKALTIALLMSALCATSKSQNVTENSATATFSMGGVEGRITFTSNRYDNVTIATVSLPVSKKYDIAIHEFPVILTQENPCNRTIVGERLINTEQSINGDTANPGTIRMPGVSMFSGDNAIVGRSIILVSNDDTICATILQQESPVAYANVQGHIAGTIHVQKVGDRYAVLTDLFSTQLLSQQTHNVKIYNGAIDMDLPSAPQQTEQTLKSSRCDKLTNARPLVDIPNVPIAGAGQRAKSLTYVTPDDISFDFSTGFMRIDADKTVVCASFHLFEKKTVAAMFSLDGVKGDMTFEQNNPYALTRVHVTLEGLNNEAGGYHVHEYPISYKYEEDTAICSGEFTGGHHDPLKANRVLSTQDDQEFGDLSSKHGPMDDKTSIDQEYEDLYLPLFGQHSIVGRSVVIHKKVGGGRWVCANIAYPGPVTTAVAEFDGFAQGWMIMVQETDKPWADSSFFVRMANAEGDETTAHKYHIHKNMTGSDQLAAEGRCRSADGHWNPFDVRVDEATVYAQSCAEKLGCEVGDLNGKFGLLTLASNAAGRYKMAFFTDVIPLSGAYSVLSRSITVHDRNKGAGRYACADIRQQLPVKLKATEVWRGPQAGVVKGSMEFSPSSTQGMTKLKVDVSGLNSEADGYHVHEKPLNIENPGQNICKKTGGHYNPLAATDTSPNLTLDKYEIGDLSNKYGSLKDASSMEMMANDTNLPIRGPNSIAGRSIVIHDKGGGRMQCSSIVYDAAAMSGMLVRGVATFTGEVQGSISFRQVVNDRGTSDVTIEAMLDYADKEQKTSAHKWHVHVSTYDGKTCKSTGGHYNPFKVDVTAETYQTCGKSKPKKCEVGDLSGKLGTLDIGGFHAVYNDDFLTLVGKQSIMGRSIVIHSKDKGANRIACADIEPAEGAMESMKYNISSPSALTFRDDMAAAVLDQLGDDYKNHRVYIKSGADDGNCLTVTVYFSGMKAADMKNQFKAESMDDYSKSDCTVSASARAGVSWTFFALCLLVISLFYN